MRQTPAGLQFSPSDILRYLDGNFAAWMDRYFHEMGQPASLLPDEDSPEDELVQRYGLRHEKAHLEALQATGVRVTSIPDKRPNEDGKVPDEERVALTLAAMRRGDPVIFQAALEAGPLFGYADFLERRDNPDGSWHYEPWDTKLAHSIKPKFVVQLCAYAEMLGAMQGTAPPMRAGAILGTNTRATVDLGEHWYTWLNLKAQFLDFHARFNPDDTPPDPSLERNHGRWSTRANESFEQGDLTVLAAGISMSQVAKLRTAGVITMAQLAVRTDGVRKLAPVTLDRLRRQAAQQVASRGTCTPTFEIVRPDPADPRRGLALLPPPSPGDVYFDIEGFPYAGPHGLEYLLGAVTIEDGQPAFHDWWAHDREAERRAFEGFVTWAWARWQADPHMHIYRYSAYEVTALKKLASRYGTFEHEVDEMLRQGVFVDLFTVVRQGLVVGTPSYSLKEIERLYRPAREGDVVTAMGSVVAYEDWLASEEPGDWRVSPRLKAIRDYNKVDCQSTLELATWLRQRQQEAGISWVPPEEEKPRQEVPTANASLALELAAAANREADAERQGVMRLVAALLEYHRREDKPAWWEYYRRERFEEDQLTDDTNCLAGLTRTDTAPRKVARSKAWEFAFDADQDSKVGIGKKWELHHNGHVPEILTLDGEKGLLEIKTTHDVTTWPERVHLVPVGPRGSDGLTAAMYRFGQAWQGNPAAYPAIADLLARRVPRITGTVPDPLVNPGSEAAEQVTDLVQRLDSSVLCIQGPPGTGKSSIAARVIARLLADGKRVAVTGQSHKVIVNLMNKVHDRITTQGVAATLLKVGDENDGSATGATWVAKGNDVPALLGDGSALVGITVYGLAYEELHQVFDYAFIDEAGQYALANAVIAGLSARNLVLIGDQAQLPQVIQGKHPDESGGSVLGHMLAGQETIRTDFGVLLDVSWRLHPAVCGWISEAFYEGRLTSAPANATHGVEHTRSGALEGFPPAGLVYVPVQHEANTQASEEEAERIRDLVNALLGRPFLRATRDAQRLTLEDILIVAPYNMQVRRIGELVPDARVGSVDKFQGQEAPVVIVSMCASSLEEVPRGVEFLLSPNRLNVAVSRAQALAIVVASPELLRVRARTVEEMALMNRHCWLVHYARAG